MHCGSRAGKGSLAYLFTGDNRRRKKGNCKRASSRSGLGRLHATSSFHRLQFSANYVALQNVAPPLPASAGYFRPYLDNMDDNPSWRFPNRRARGWKEKPFKIMAICGSNLVHHIQQHSSSMSCREGIHHTTPRSTKSSGAVCAVTISSIF